MPQELIDPISTLSGKKPVLKEITNWYFDMPRCLPLLTEWLDKMEKTELRPFVVKEIREFLKKPEIYIKKDQMDKFEDIRYLLPTFEMREEKDTSSCFLDFEKHEEREYT